jgi:hypothetical protein
VVAPGWLIISWPPSLSNPILFINFFGIGQGCRRVLRARAQTAGNLQINSCACGNLSFLATYFVLDFLYCRMLREMLRPNKDEVTGEWRRLHNEVIYFCIPHQILFR